LIINYNRTVPEQLLKWLNENGFKQGEEPEEEEEP